MIGRQRHRDQRSSGGRNRRTTPRMKATGLRAAQQHEVDHQGVDQLAAPGSSRWRAATTCGAGSVRRSSPKSAMSSSCPIRYAVSEATYSRPDQPKTRREGRPGQAATPGWSGSAMAIWMTAKAKMRRAQAQEGHPPRAVGSVELVEDVGEDEGQREGQHADRQVDAADPEELAADQVRGEQRRDEQPRQPEVELLLRSIGTGASAMRSGRRRSRVRRRSIGCQCRFSRHSAASAPSHLA